MVTLATELSVLVTLATDNAGVQTKPKIFSREQAGHMHGSKIFVQTIFLSTVLHFGAENSGFYGICASTVLHFGGENSSYSYMLLYVYRLWRSIREHWSR